MSEQTQAGLEVDTALAGVRDAIDVRRVFGEPVERDGVTLVPVAAVRGGGGGGSGDQPDGSSSGAGLGFGVTGRPVGAYVIRAGQVTWRPAVDVTRLAGWAAVLTVVWLLTGRRRRS